MQVKEINEKTKVWMVYGAPGHRQKASFGESVQWDWSSEQLGTRRFLALNADKTGTNDYTIVSITRNNAQECVREMDGQVSDGYFEDNRVGDVVELDISILFGPFGSAVFARDQSMKNRVRVDLQEDGSFSRAEEYAEKFMDALDLGVDCTDEILELVSTDEEILCALAKRMHEARNN